MIASPVASLPMYDWPEVQWANDFLWAGVRDRLREKGMDAPDALDRHQPREEVWTDPSLLLSQTCAWPFATRLVERVQLVGTPIYDAEGCAGALYSSFLVARVDQTGDALAAFAGRRFAYNSQDSLSGYVALRAAMASEGMGVERVDWLETGGHRESLRAVAEGAADLAAIDSVCWALASRHEPAAVARLRVVNRTPLRPGLPLITSGQADAAAAAVIRTAITAALHDDATVDVRRALFMADVELLPRSDYDAVARLAA